MTIVPQGPNNWGRWGEDDQNGTLNYIGSEQVRYASSLVTSGERFSLGLPIEAAAPRHPVRSPAKHYVTSSGSDAVIDTPMWTTDFVWTDDNIDMATHGSTHFDALAHVSIGHTMFNGYWAGAVSSSGAEVLAIGRQARGFVGRGVLIDVARHLRLRGDPGRNEFLLVAQPFEPPSRTRLTAEPDRDQVAVPQSGISEVCSPSALAQGLRLYRVHRLHDRDRLVQRHQRALEVAGGQAAGDLVGLVAQPAALVGRLDRVGSPSRGSSVTVAGA